MTFLLGTDEAGYGPNLGPLVVSGTLWQVPGASECVDLYERLQGCVRTGPVGREPSDRLTIADSKMLYTSGSGVDRLELGVLAALSVVGRSPDSNVPSPPAARRDCGGDARVRGGEFSSAARGNAHPATWRQLWTSLDPESETERQELPWYVEYDVSLPVAADRQTVQQAAEQLQQGLARVGVSLGWIQSTAVYPRRLNELIEQLGSKGAALSQVTLRLIDKLLCRATRGPVSVICDKHGGRNRYGPLLQRQFPDYVVEVCHETRAESLYRTGPRDRRVEFRFRAQGEQFLPSALASMVSKYLRELSMTAFNDFWRRSQPNLRPTAGYPVDARRFRKEIAEQQAQLAIDDRLIWRHR